MARTKMVCEEPSVAAVLKAKLLGEKPPKAKCKRVKVDKESSNSIASSINWGNKYKKS